MSDISSGIYLEIIIILHCHHASFIILIIFMRLLLYPANTETKLREKKSEHFSLVQK